MTRIISNPFKVNELARMVSGRVVGDGETVIERIADVENAADSEIAYVENESFLAAATGTRAGCLIVAESLSEKLSDRTVIVATNPKLAFSLIGAALHPPVRRPPSIHATAVVADTADIALSVYVGPH